MFLSSARILELVDSGSLKIEPLDLARFKPASYVLGLGDRFRRWIGGRSHIAVWQADAARDCLGPIEKAEKITIPPGVLVLACTREVIALSDSCAGVVSTLSHLARFGLMANLGANWINPGFGARTPTALTLELVNYNPNPITMPAGAPICHLRITEVQGPRRAAGMLMRSIYEGRDPLCAPQYFEEFAGISSPRTNP